MAKEELNRPLGLPPERKPRGRRRYLLAGGALVVVALATVVAGWEFVSVPPATAPTATAVINKPPPGLVSSESTGSTVSTGGDTGGGLSEITPDGSISGGGTVVIHDPSEPSPIQLASLPQDDLVEPSSDGPLPRIAADGTRPLDAYARPSDADSHDMRIAIVIGGFGIDPEATTQALGTLPGPVTLAFAPYGDGLPKLVADARTAGHELLLQVPLEPYNYPKTNPGQNTLTTDATPAVNLDRLHWFLGRMTNYVGVVNYMGARFTSEADALQPVMSEVGTRGLLYLDDGSSARSVAGSLAGAGTPFLRADVVLDADLSAGAIDAQLAQLQAIARQRGYAIGIGTAFPLTIGRVAAFAKAAADKGIDIVPLSALVGSGS